MEKDGKMYAAFIDLEKARGIGCSKRNYGRLWQSMGCQVDF